MYLFVDAATDQRDPWWGTFFARLLSIPVDRNGWKKDPERDVYVNSPILTDSDKVAIADWLKSAPRYEADKNPTLRRAVQLTAKNMTRLRLVFFS